MLRIIKFLVNTRSVGAIMYYGELSGVETFCALVFHVEGLRREKSEASLKGKRSCKLPLIENCAD
jgi:hypothetical protein